jgi:uncharacterized protein (UPF0332 family)
MLTVTICDEKNGNLHTNLQNGDVDGASNRAYIAIFDAAQAALLMSGVSAPDALGKTCRGLINTFSAYLVKDGPVSKKLGRQLKRAEDMRMVDDCNGESITQADVADVVAKAEVFVSTMQIIFSECKAAPGDTAQAGDVLTDVQIP